MLSIGVKIVHTTITDYSKTPRFKTHRCRFTDRAQELRSYETICHILSLTQHASEHIQALIKDKVLNFQSQFQWGNIIHCWCGFLWLLRHMRVQTYLLAPFYSTVVVHCSIVPSTDHSGSDIHWLTGTNKLSSQTVQPTDKIRNNFRWKDAHDLRPLI